MSEERYTPSGIRVKPFYTPEDVAEKGIQYSRDLGDPGSYPYTRGIRPAMYREVLWDMCQYGGFGTGSDTKERVRFLRENGATSFYIALDLPTQLGYDSDDPNARHHVGRVGVAIDSLWDLEQIFDGVSLAELGSVKTTANAIGPIMAALFIALCEKKGETPDDFELVIQNDPLKEFFVRGTYIFPPKPALQMSTDVIEYFARYAKRWQPIEICGCHMHSTGATAVQELAFTFSNAIVYTESTLRRGLSTDDFASQLQILSTGQLHLFEEIAKYRAMRRMWAKLFKERFGATDPRSLALTLNLGAAGSTLTAQEPLNNIARLTVEALALVLSGGQYIMTPAYDEAKGIPTADSARVALRIQQVLAYETGLTDVADPLAGSYYLESLTHDMEAMAWQEIEKVERLGGSLAAIESGYFEREITREAYKQHRAIESGERVVVGVNRFSDPRANHDTPVFHAKPDTEERQRARLAEVRARRDHAAVEVALKKVRRAAEEGDNMIPACVEAVKAYATIGEICGELRQLWGEYDKPAILA